MTSQSSKIAGTFLLMVLLIFATGTFAQKPPSNNVVLHVRVTDSVSHAVVDVPENNFKILEDGIEQKISFFSKEEVPLSYGLLIDNSGSLRTQLNAVVTAAIRIVKSNKPTDEAFLVRFISSDKIQVVQETTSEQELLINGLEGLYVEGGATAVIDAVYLASEKLAKQSTSNTTIRRRALVLVTDGEDRESF